MNEERRIRLIEDIFNKLTECDITFTEAMSVLTTVIAVCVPDRELNRNNIDAICSFVRKGLIMANLQKIHDMIRH